MVGAFNTFLENDAFDKAKLLPRSGPEMFLAQASPFQVWFRTTEQGWDVVEFDEVNHLTDAYHLDFSNKRGKITWERKLVLLERIKSYSP